uniref:F-box domain-containing protein n=1 Tax=Plectus sambesii TaxID=2011161 RepID=A0A914VN71_9BILA
MGALETEVDRLQAENDRLRRVLSDLCERIVCGRLTGDLPDNFLEQFSRLPDQPLEKVLRFLPAHQVAQMRHVSRRFNHLIKKCSKTMPKMRRDGTVVFKTNSAGELTVDWFDFCGQKFTETILVGDEVALSELVRLIHIGGTVWFAQGLSATDEILVQLSMAWLEVCPEVVIFSGDLSHTSRDSLRAFLVKVQPFLGRLHFQNVNNIVSSLLSDDVIGAAGWLEGLMIKPECCGSELLNFNIGDETLLSLFNVDSPSSYFLVMGCSGITPNGIRAFIEKWMKKERLEEDASISDLGLPLEFCKLTFYKCANVTPAAIEEVCGDLLKKITPVEPDDSFVGGSEEKKERIRFTSYCPSTNCRLEILFHYVPLHNYYIDEPEPNFANDYYYHDYHEDSESEIENDDIDDYDGHDAIDYDDEDDSDLD